jgi:hypothetical protein
MTDASPIVLCTLNAKYLHASLGLRCLRANLGAMRARSRLVEFTIQDRPTDLAERLLAMDPAVVAFGVYVWNVAETTRVVTVLRAVRPDLPIVVGGPEVSHELDGLLLAELVTTVVSGPGEAVFAGLCEDLLAGRPVARRVVAPNLPVDQLVLPYDEYTEEDLDKRLTYVEASRGCVFRCSFCLSALDRAVTPFPLDTFLGSLRALRDRGATHFKFVDRTFNLAIDASLRVLDTLCSFLEDGRPLFAHFEVIPDHMPDRLIEALARFPAGSLQLEVGIQSLDPAVHALVSRRQNDAKALANLVRLRAETHAHLHTDLIFGLPGETLEGFGRGFDRLVTTQPHEIQVGMLKRLRGAPIAERIRSHALVFDPDPPYTIWSTSTVDFPTVQRMVRFARYWDLVGNSGRFVEAREAILGDAPFVNFMAFSDWLYALTGSTHNFAYERLVDLVVDWLELRGGAPDAVRAALARDYHRAGARGAPKRLEGRLEQPKRRDQPSARGTARQARVAD